jgi:hypothetical protein
MFISISGEMGGGNWRLEFNKWEEEEARYWMLATKKKRKPKIAHSVHFASPIHAPSPKFKSRSSLVHSAVQSLLLALPRIVL